MAGTEPAPGVHPGTAGGFPDPSDPFTWYGAEFAPLKATFWPASVIAEGKLSPYDCATTKYCVSFSVPFGSTENDVTSSTWLAVAGMLAGAGLGLGGFGTIRLGFGTCAVSLKSGVVGSTNPSWFTSVLSAASVTALMRTHLNSGPGIPAAFVPETEGIVWTFVGFAPNSCANWLSG